jgi:hypothetical protein
MPALCLNCCLMNPDAGTLLELLPDESRCRHSARTVALGIQMPTLCLNRRLINPDAGTQLELLPEEFRCRHSA